MNDHLFSNEVLADYYIKLEWPARQKQMKNYTIKVEDKDKEDVKGSSGCKSCRCKMCNG